MNIVVDTSVLVAVVADEPEREPLIEVTRSAELIAPHSVHWEVGNAFSAMMKRKRISLASAVKAIKAYQKIKVRFVEIDIEKALRIAHRHSVYAYDAYVIVCALQHKAPLVSLDKNLIFYAKQSRVHVLEVRV